MRSANTAARDRLARRSSGVMVLEAGAVEMAEAGLDTAERMGKAQGHEKP
ncbi:hypothetical protein GCM10028785_35670 [Hydrogenophaga soli]